MVKMKVRVWKTILRDYYAEISNGFYGSNLAKITIDPETRKIQSIDGHTYRHVDDEFIENATMIAETIVSYKQNEEYPWHEHENVAWKALNNLFTDGRIPKKMPTLKQPTGELEYY
jgi:hypothetical protein